MIDDHVSPYTTYCDFESDAPFIWTLLESLSLEESQKDVNRVSFNVDHTLEECNLAWSKFRLSKIRIDSIKSSYGTTHYRVTCNFNAVNGTGLVNRRDYLRDQVCNNEFLYITHSSDYCVKVAFMNIRGQTCRSCSVSQKVTGSIHNHIDLSLTSSTCKTTTFSDAIPNEDVFGQYSKPNPLFSCAANKDSTTQWWVGGLWVEESLS